jgi:tetratricopeptide (TPR) repeat protein
MSEQYISSIRMDSLLPFIYLLIIFIFLGFGFVFILAQIIFTQDYEKTISLLSFDLSGTEKLSCFTYFKVGICYLQKGSYQNALKSFSVCLNEWDINDNIGRAWLYNTIGFTYYKSGNLNFAKYYYEQAILTVPGYIISLSNLDFLYEDESLFKQSIGICLRIRELYEQMKVFYIDDPKKVEKFQKSIDNYDLRLYDLFSLDLTNKMY